MFAPSRIVRLLAVAIAAVVALTVSPAPATAGPTAAETKYGNKVFTKVNNFRANNGRAKLNRNKCLQRFANRQAERMAEKRRMFHQDLRKIQSRCGVGFVAENVAYSSLGPSSVVQGWKNSPGHRKNMLGRIYKKTGVAARKGGGLWWVAQVFASRN